MGAVDDNELYPIGDVARRTGLSVSAIRFYAEAGVVMPTSHSDVGYRLYDIHAIAGLELVRTLRELGASLADIRQLLVDEMTLHDLATAHLALVEGQMRRLRARQAVLRTIVKQGRNATDQVSLMHKLVSMADDERCRLIEEFWDEVTDGLEVRPALVERLRNRRPNLPEEPSTEQLEAWIELADIVQDADFRGSVRRFLHDTFSTERARMMSSPLMVEQQEKQQAIFLEAQAAQQAGVSSDSAQAQGLAERFVASIALTAGGQDSAELRRRMAAYEASAEAKRAPEPVARYGALFGRYLTLVSTINGKTEGERERDKAANVAAVNWLMEAVKVPGPGGEAGDGGETGGGGGGETGEARSGEC